MGNLITAAGAFAFGADSSIHWSLFALALCGLALVIGSGCACNHYSDRHADKMMERTKKRPLVIGAISPVRALVFAAIIGIFGFSLLFWGVNPESALAAAVGWIVYVAIYGTLKYKTVYGTLIGSVAGATPPVVGYCAASGHFDIWALFLFFLLIVWQMPHFFAIAMYRHSDYAAAKIPVLPIVRGSKAAKVHMFSYVAVFALLAPIPFFAGRAGSVYLMVALALGTGWLLLSFSGSKRDDDAMWAKQMFRCSLVVISGLFGALAF